MSNPAPVAPFLPPTVEPVGGEAVPPGGGGVDVPGFPETALPFTGSVFTAPIAILGLVLTLVGWALLRLGLRED
jgi:hypothetical protein